MRSQPVHHRRCRCCCFPLPLPKHPTETPSRAPIILSDQAAIKQRDHAFVVAWISLCVAARRMQLGLPQVLGSSGDGGFAGRPKNAASALRQGRPCPPSVAVLVAITIVTVVKIQPPVAVGVIAATIVIDLFDRTTSYGWSYMRHSGRNRSGCRFLRYGNAQQTSSEHDEQQARAHAGSPSGVEHSSNSSGRYAVSAKSRYGTVGKSVTAFNPDRRSSEPPRCKPPGATQSDSLRSRTFPRFERMRASDRSWR
jgi:hypothetical protein